MTAVALIGPLGVGKTTTAKLLANELGLPIAHLDDLKWTYFEETDFDHATAKRIIREDISRIAAYSAPYSLHAVERTIDDHADHVLDFGAGLSTFDEPKDVERFKQALRKVETVVLLMPSRDVAESLASLPGPEQGIRLNERFVTHPLQYEVADAVVYTLHKDPAAVADETLAAIRHR